MLDLLVNNVENIEKRQINDTESLIFHAHLIIIKLQIEIPKT